MAKTKTDILRHLPRYYIDNLLFGAIFDAVAPELTLAEDQVDYTARQAFIGTCVEEIERWENELGLPVDTSRPIADRRRSCRAKLIGLDATTPAVLKRMVDEIVVGEDCTITENYSAYYVIVQFVKTWGYPPEETELRRLIEQILPAHLVLDFAYRFNTWQEVKDNLPTWNDVLAWGDWDDVLTEKVIP